MNIPMSRRLALFVVLSIGCVAFAQLQPCTDAEGKRALSEAVTLRTWDALYKSYGLYRNCDDGAVGEGYSESVARVLVDHWSTLPRLAYLARKDPDFRHFVLTHVDATLDMKDVEKIRGNADSHCPNELRKLCRDLREQAKSALQDASSP